MRHLHLVESRIRVYSHFLTNPSAFNQLFKEPTLKREQFENGKEKTLPERGKSKNNEHGKDLIKHITVLDEVIAQEFTKH